MNKKANEIMEELFSKETYQSWSQSDNMLDLIRDELKSRMPEEENRKVFKEQGVIARFVKSPSYTIDTLGLNELLSDLGILVHVARFKDTEELSEFRNEAEKYTKFNLGKLGRTPKLEFDFSRLSDDEIIGIWLREKKNSRELEAQIDMAKEEMMRCEELRLKGLLRCNYGSVSLLDKKRTHDNEKILEVFGTDYMIEHSTPNMETLEKFVTQGIILQKEVDQFRSLSKLNTKFVITEMSDYQKMMDGLSYKSSLMSQNLQELWAHRA